MVNIRTAHQKFHILIAALALTWLTSSCAGLMSPDPVTQLRKAADQHRENGEYTAAERAYLEAIELDGDDDALQADLARLYLAWDRPGRGLEALEGISTAQNPPPLDIQRLRVQLLQADGQWAAAISGASQILADAPADEAAWQALVAAYLGLHECDRAQAAVVRAVKLGDPAPAEMIEIARLIAPADLEPEAQYPTPGTAACADNCDFTSGLQLVRQRRWGLAACLLDRALQKSDPEIDADWIPEAHAWLGETLVQIGQERAAGPHFRLAVDLAPRSPLPWLLLGKYTMTQGNFETAEEALYNAHQFDTENPAPCLAMAELYAAQGHYEDASDWIDAALERAPGDAGIWVSAARFYLIRDLAAESKLEAITEHALVVAPDDPDALVVAGWHRINSAQPEAALEVLDQAIEAAPESAEAHYLRAVALQATGAMEASRAELTRAADLGDPRAQR